MAVKIDLIEILTSSLLIKVLRPPWTSNDCISVLVIKSMTLTALVTNCNNNITSKKYSRQLLVSLSHRDVFDFTTRPLDHFQQALHHVARDESLAAWLVTGQVVQEAEQSCG